MLSRVMAFCLLASSLSLASVADDVRNELANHNFEAAETALQTYRQRQGVTPDYLEGLSWMARASLAASSKFPRAIS